MIWDKSLIYEKRMPVATIVPVTCMDGVKSKSVMLPQKYAYFILLMYRRMGIDLHYRLILRKSSFPPTYWIVTL